MPTILPRRVVNDMLVVPADSPYIDHPPRDLRWLGAVFCIVCASSTATLIARFVAVL